MNRLFTCIITIFILSGCSLVTLPVKVATKTVETAVDVTAATVDVITPDRSANDKKDKPKEKTPQKP